MLEIRLLGQFDIRFDGKSIEVHSRPAQSLLAYLVLNAGISQRREKLAGILWPDSTEAKSRSYLRQALWRIRKALTAYPLSWRDYMRTDDISVEFGGTSECWLDVDVVLERKDAETCTVEELIQIASVYRGELLPGFYDEWVYLERERLRAAYEHKMKLLLDRLLRDRCWEDVLHWGEQWISLGYASETAYRELMIAHASMGDTSSAIATFNRCVENLERELGVEPSPATQEIHDQLINGKIPEVVPIPPVVPEQALTDDPPGPGEPPFKGLQFFDEADADIFFGREVLTASLVNHLREGQSLLVVVGASGSGKSSIVRAGLVPALRCGEPLIDGKRPPKGSEDWLIHVITPTPHPLIALATNLTRNFEMLTNPTALRDDMSRDPRSLHLTAKRIMEDTGAPKLLLVVDQFEELFTVCREEAERKAFIDNLLTSVESEGNGPITVVITLRADFYAHCSEYPQLRKAIAQHQEYIGPMSAREMRRAIEEPARRGEWDFQPGMVDLFLRDVKGEPGALPLLSHALLETWHRRSGRTLTLKSYAASGGVGGAIAKTADTVFNSHLTLEQQVIARNIFLRLTGLSEDTQHTRRRVEASELVLDPDDAPAVENVITILADARLITTYEDTVEVAHEALIREWPALQEWLEEDREGLKLHRHLTESAQEWQELNRDHGELYRGARLAQAVDWARGNDGQLNELERAFLSASQTLAAEEQVEREARRQRELETTQKLAEAEERRASEWTSTGPRTRWLAIGLSAFLVIAVIAILSLFGDRLAPGINVQPTQVANVSETKIPELPSTGEGYEVGDLIFEDDFDDNPSNQWNYARQPWDTRQIDGRTVLVADYEKSEFFSLSILPSAESLRQDYLVEFDFYLSRPNYAGYYSLQIQTRQYECSPLTSRSNTHMLDLTPEGMDFSRGACNPIDEFEQRSNYSVSPGEWHRVKIINYLDKYEAMIDGIEIFNFNIDNPIMGGAVILEIRQAGIEYYIDNFRVYELTPDTDDAPIGLTPEDGDEDGELLIEDDSNQIPFELIDDGALLLGGGNDMTEIDYAPALAINDEITIEAWIKVNKFPPCNLRMDCWSDTCRYIAILSQAHSDSSAGNYTLAVGPDGLLFAFESVDTRLMGNIILPEGEWIHIAVAHRWGDGTATRFYVNSIPVENTQWVDDWGNPISGDEFPHFNSGSPYYIGGFGISPSTRNWNTFNGEIDELRIWKVHRSKEEILATMNRELVGNEPFLSAYWNFNVSIGSLEVVDQSSNGNTAYLTGGAKIVSGEELILDLPSPGEGYEVGDLIFEDDFDDGPSSNIWNFVCEQEWDTKQINGRTVFVADWDRCDGADTFQLQVLDYLVEFDFFLSRPSQVGDYALIIATRAFGCYPVTQRHTRSELSLAPEGEYFLFAACDSNDQFEARNDFSVSDGEWHTMRTINFEDKYQAFIDDTEIFNLFVINLDIGGNIVFDVLPGTEYYIDNFRAYELLPKDG